MPSRPASKAIVAVSMDLNSCCKNLEIKKRSGNRAYCPGDGDASVGGQPAGRRRVPGVDPRQPARIIRRRRDRAGFWYKWVRKDEAKKSEQREVFRAFLEGGQRAGSAGGHSFAGVWRECFETTQSVGVRKAVFHWYSGPADVLNDIIKPGYFVSTTPSVAYSPQSRRPSPARPSSRR